MATKDLNVILGLRVENFQKNLKSAQRSMMKFGRDMERLGSNLTKTLTLPIIGVGTGAIKAFTDIERFEKGLTAVMGSSESAATELQNLQKAARMPGLGFKEAVQGSIRLQSVGFSANEARETLMAFGAAIAATGGTAQNLESVQYQLTQMISKNRILQEDFSIIQENVPLVGKAIEVAFGTRNIEQIRATGISAEDFNRRIVAALKTLPETQTAVGGLGNAFENLKDTLTVSFAEFGRAINESLKLEDKIEILGNLVQNLVQRFKALSPEAKQTAINVALIVSAIGPLSFVIGKFATIVGGLIGQMKGLVSVVKTFATFLLGVPGIILAAIAAITYLYYESDTARKVINGLVDSVASLVDIFRAGASATEMFFSILRGDATSAGAAFVSMQSALSDFQRQIGDVDFGDAENKISGSIERLKGKINNLLTLKPTISEPTTTPTDSGITPSGETTGGFAPIQPINLLPTDFPQQIESINLAKDAQELLNESLLKTQERQAALREENERRLEQDDRIAQALERENTLINGITSAVGTLTDSIFEAISSGKDIFKSLANSVKQLVVQLIKAVVQAAILSTLLNIIAPGSSLVTSGRATFSALLGLPGFANGGLVTGPTVALVGEGVGTTRTNPEVIAPLDKLQGMLAMNQGTGYIASTRLQGSDILLAIERAERDRTR